MSSEKRLFVLRHAKSSWDDPGLDDHERPLGQRGQRTVKLLAEHIRAAGVRPVLVLCSSARRTRETLEGVLPGGESTIEPELYEASCATVIELLRRRVPDETASVMVVGHNPAMHMLVLELGGAGGPGHEDRAVDSEPAEVRDKFPTGALATLAFEGSWSRLAPGCARLVEYVRPKDLTP